VFFGLGALAAVAHVFDLQLVQGVAAGQLVERGRGRVVEVEPGDVRQRLLSGGHRVRQEGLKC
jgi:hypothetical protein